MSNSHLSPPTKTIIHKLHAAEYPSVYPYVQWVLILCSICYFLVIFLCITILTVPFFRGAKSRAKHYWLWRRHYMGHRVAYLVPNGGIAVAIAQIFGCTLFEVYILLSYQVIRSPKFAHNHYQYAWLAISYAPGYFGFWYSAFGALYACLFSPSRPDLHEHSKISHLPNPILMNTICIGTPILTAIGSVGWAIESFLRTREKNEAYEQVISRLSHGLDPTRELARYAESGHKFILQFRWAAFFWSIGAALAVFFYCFTIFLFLRVLKGTVDVANGKKNLLQKYQSDPQEVRSDSPPAHRSISMISLPLKAENPRIAEKLGNGYRYLILYCGLLTMVLTCYFFVGVLITVNIGKTVTSETWRSLFGWLVVSSSLLMTSALVVQSLRVLRDGCEKQGDIPDPIIKSSKPPDTLGGSNTFVPPWAQSEQGEVKDLDCCESEISQETLHVTSARYST